MHAHEGAGALPVDVEVPAVKALLGLRNPEAVAAEVRAREAVFARIRERDSRLEVLRLGNGEDGPEDLFPEDARRGLDVVEDGGGGEVADSPVPRPARSEPSLAL